MARSQQQTAKGKKAPRTPYSVTEAANILGMSRRATSQAARAGKLDGVFGGLMGTRLIGITPESLKAILDCRKAHQTHNGGDKHKRPAAR